MTGTGLPWSVREIETVDECLAAGLGPKGGSHFFPNRSFGALHSKFGERRRALGIPTRRGKRPKPDTEILAKVSHYRREQREASARELEKAARIASSNKSLTDATPEALSCATLLRRHLETGAHWLLDPERFASACRSVGL